LSRRPIKTPGTSSDKALAFRTKRLLPRGFMGKNIKGSRGKLVAAVLVVALSTSFPAIAGIKTSVSALDLARAIAANDRGGMTITLRAQLGVASAMTPVERTG
jgi:hypothetical protein